MQIRNAGKFALALSSIVSAALVLGGAPAHAAQPAAKNPVVTVKVGANPQLPAVTNTRVFVPNQGSNTVTVIDRATNTTSEIALGSAPTAALVVGTRIWVRLSDAKQYAVVNPDSLTIEQYISVGAQPSLPAISDGGLVVAISNTGDNTVTVIQGDTGTIAFTSTVGRSPQRGTFGSQDTDLKNKLFIPNGDDGTVSVISLYSNTVVQTLNVGGKLGDAIASPIGSPAGHKVYIPQHDVGAEIRIIDQDSLDTSDMYFLDGDGLSSPLNIVNAGNNLIAPAEGAIQTRNLVDGSATDSLDVTQFTKGWLGAGDVSADGKWALYSSPKGPFTPSAPYVTLVNTSNQKVTAFLKVGNTPGSLSFAPTGAVAYVSNAGDGTVSVIDLATPFWPSAPRKTKVNEQRNGWGMKSTVSWKKPERPSGLVDYYVAPTDTVKHCSTKQTSCTVKNLSAHKGYSYQVRARSAFAIGSAGWAHGK